MTAGQFKAWLRKANMKKCLEREHWDKLVSITKSEFRDGNILEALEWTTMALITKGEGGYRGIVLVEVIWKVCAAIVNTKIRDELTPHDALHGFRKERRAGIATIEAKLAQKRAVIIH